ncbi:MAG: S8 family serine peptidase [Bacteroidetes bacterium]|nr:S8 family serine peptidase [Bacteroidota bacterium]
MKKSLSVIIVLFSLTAYSQVAENCYRLFLTDKDHSPYSLDKPEEFLSPEAILRREKQEIEIRNNDLPISKYYTDSLNKLGLQILNQSKWLNSVVVYTLDTELIDTIRRYGFIKSKQKIEKNLTPKTAIGFGLNAEYLVTKNQDNALDYGYGTTQIAMINGHVLHQNGYKGQGMTIAVIDGGFYKVDELPAFDSLWTNSQILGTRDFVDGDYNVYHGSDHGMKVLSTMASNIPGELIGTAPKANYWLLRSEYTPTENSIEEDNWVAAAEFADSVGCDIITSSLGYSEFDDPQQNYSYSDMDGNTTVVTRAADIAASKGILVLNSAGNAGDDEWKYITAPADGDSVLTVGAVDEYAQYVYFSGLGPTSDGRIKPNVSALGYQTSVQGVNGAITIANGTSFSTPIIAGMAACLWQSVPDLTNMEIIQRIEESAHQYSTPDYYLGYGIPDFAKAAHITSSDIIAFAEKSMIKVYPNPFTDNIHIELLLNTEDELSVQLYNMLGEKVLEVKSDAGEYAKITLNNLTQLSTGIYIIHVKAGNVIMQQRIIKLQ